MKYIISKKKKEENLGVTNTNDLQQWVSTLHVNVESDSFKSLSWDSPFVPDFEIKDENFVIMIITKSLLQNLLKQANSDSSLLSIDATYNLNQPGYPTIVVGKIDLHRKFHLGNYLSSFVCLLN